MTLPDQVTLGIWIAEAYIPGTDGARATVGAAMAKRLHPRLVAALREDGAHPVSLVDSLRARLAEAEEVANKALEREHAIFLATGADKWGMGNTTALQAVETLVANCAGYQKRAEELVAEAQRAETRAAEARLSEREYRQERDEARYSRDDIGAKLDAATLAVEELTRELEGLRKLKDRRTEVVVPSQARGGPFGAVPVLATDRDLAPLVPLTAERLAEAWAKAECAGMASSAEHIMKTARVAVANLTGTGYHAGPEFETHSTAAPFQFPADGCECIAEDDGIPCESQPCLCDCHDSDVEDRVREKLIAEGSCPECVGPNPGVTHSQGPVTVTREDGSTFETFAFRSHTCVACGGTGRAAPKPGDLLTEADPAKPAQPWLHPSAAVHKVKCHPDPFNAVSNRSKDFEIRLDDRGYQVGHWLELHKYSPATGFYPVAPIVRRICYRTVLADWIPGIDKRWVVLGLDLPSAPDDPALRSPRESMEAEVERWKAEALRLRGVIENARSDIDAIDTRLYRDGIMTTTTTGGDR